MTMLADSHGVQVHATPWASLLAHVTRCDALIVDAPYSEKTHAGHDGGTALTSKVWKRSNGEFDVPAARRSITYGAWTTADVHTFVQAWHPLTDGWFVSITDDVLAPVWKEALEATGRYVFAPLPYVAPGSRVRLSGDGPSAWTCWIIVARPRTREFASWGTLPGSYVLPAGMAERMPVVGGKPPWLLCRLAEDYSRAGGLIVDPTCGAGTAGIGAIRTGRRAILGDAHEPTAQIAAQWIRNPYGPAPGVREREAQGQIGLFGEVRP